MGLEHWLFKLFGLPPRFEHLFYAQTYLFQLVVHRNIPLVSDALEHRMPCEQRRCTGLTELDRITVLVDVATPEQIRIDYAEIFVPRPDLKIFKWSPTLAPITMM